MLTATEILSVSVTAFYICFPTNISILQQNKRQFNSLSLVNIIYPFFGLPQLLTLSLYFFFYGIILHTKIGQSL
nr:MAG TPA: hypothetical protein [Caudoviricetes sp.]